ncbi:hypothetical protein ACN9MZ_26040 [Pseudoduganella sp. S-14]|uniref:hypothetical protein n=1 Tax=Pseudoduganella sp. S-14 TaxID=3404065 RepID=UPI003CFA2F11
MVKSVGEDKSTQNFFEEIRRAGIDDRYLVCRLDETSLTDYLKELYVKKGISSLFNFSIVCDAVLHPGLHVDEITNVIVESIMDMKGVRNLIVIDPYLFASATDSMALDLLRLIIGAIGEDLESVTLITNGKARNKREILFNAIKSVKSSINVKDVKTDEFHDRFWIDPESNKGVVMGTSLNGIGKKIALIDKLQSHDVKEISRLALKIMKPN